VVELTNVPCTTLAPKRQLRVDVNRKFRPRTITVELPLAGPLDGEKLCTDETTSKLYNGPNDPKSMPLFEAFTRTTPGALECVRQRT